MVSRILCEYQDFFYIFNEEGYSGGPLLCTCGNWWVVEHAVFSMAIMKAIYSGILISEWKTWATEGIELVIGKQNQWLFPHKCLSMK